MTVRCKMHCGWVTPPRVPLGSTDYDMAEVRLNAVFEGDKQPHSENAIFGRWTPQANLTMRIHNPAAARYFIPGLEYYIDIKCVTPITEEHIQEKQTQLKDAKERLAQCQGRMDAATTSQNAIAISSASSKLTQQADLVAACEWALQQVVALYAEQQQER